MSVVVDDDDDDAGWSVATSFSFLSPFSLGRWQFPVPTVVIHHLQLVNFILKTAKA